MTGFIQTPEGAGSVSLLTFCFGKLIETTYTFLSIEARIPPLVLDCMQFLAFAATIVTGCIGVYSYFKRKK